MTRRPSVLLDLCTECSVHTRQRRLLALVIHDSGMEKLHAAGYHDLTRTEILQAPDNHVLVRELLVH